MNKITTTDILRIIREKLTNPKNDIPRPNDKVVEFISWYKENRCDKYNKDYFGNKLYDFIEKMACFYEMRLPINYIETKFKNLGEDVEFFKYNANEYYLNSQLANIADEKERNAIREFMEEFDYSKYFDTHSFIESLDGIEKGYLRPKFKSYVRIDTKYSLSRNAKIYFTKRGIVEETKDMELVPDWGAYCHDPFVGMSAEELVEFMKKHKMTLKEDNELEAAIKDYKEQLYLKKELLNCVMYRLMERGGTRIGARRAFLFAKDFCCDISIPMKYGIDTSDPELGYFILTYLKSGGSSDITCYDFGGNYEIDEYVEEVLLQDIIKIKFNNLDYYPQNIINIYNELITKNISSNQKKLQI